MNKEEKAFDDLDLTVGRAIDDAVAALAAGDIDHALEALDRALKASESNPIYSKRASTEFFWPLTRRLCTMARSAWSTLA